MKSIPEAIRSGHGNAVLYAGMLGLILSDIVPTPADAVYFSLMQKNKAKLQANEITPKHYWTRDALLYYGLNPLWWSLVFSVVYFTKGDFSQKAKVGLAIIAGGAVIGVLHKNIKKDEELKSKELK